MKFEYQAIDDDGVIVRGIIKAKNPEKVLKILLYKQLHPLDIRPLTDSTIELSRLHNLKKKLQEPNKMEDPISNLRPVEAQTPKQSIDWTYLLFIIFLSIVMTLATLFG